ncbi:Chromosome partition protein Smc(Structural maintenance of chromosomes protein, prokaryotic,3-1142) [Magnetospirillum sp. XM-1]|uniref:chromosome segregation protein SMC n=1 Tax=Magnetospirillum sp. XM-1 TaxID=1663591 RepID=UPI00073DFC26|nr:chromosome segregation protein SMC [Magnetospirillum sp. XM-1]CUW38399.1 Chromosome partition protein Smc(Structural maintenance of chromosomes protein, prokaryotic,3-1142) [Magnetospirillum sp. XM-1]
MIQFTKLRLSGFKSFVDPAELLIEPGMTGVVGPNGCGKSNLIEALRWVMGETSARQMRGGEMDDVIFGGTSGRPARNVAEVMLGLDNTARTAPPQFDRDEIEVMRRIERGNGSNYRINGADTRARDVQLLFADAATGARSSGLVSQGRVGALINAKPADRRSLLEEAAGISGLYSRRHEAELRLKNAELNLSRLDDVLNTLDEQLKSLQKQARQANRYRTLSEQIRRIEAQVLYLGWLEALVAVDAARSAFREAEMKVEEATGHAANASAQQAETAAGLPDLRRAEADSASTLQKVMAEREQLEAEEGRLAELRRDLERRLEQAGADLQREHARAADSAQALARLEEERALLAEAGEGEAEAKLRAEEAVDLAAEAVVVVEQELSALMEEVAAADAERAAALRRLSECETRLARLAERLAQAERQKAEVEGESIDRSDLTALEMELEETLEFLEESREQAETADRRRVEALAARESARDSFQAASAAKSRLAAEADGLRQVLAQGKAGDHRPVLDDISARTGFEPALAAALGEDLSAPIDASAPLHWEDLGPLDHPPVLPDGAEPLSRFVAAPPQLARRLSQVGVVKDMALGEALRPRLAVGQRLVTPEGDLWRWDGYVARSGAPSPMALRLAQRNRLRELDAALDDASIGVEEAEEKVEAATREVDTAAEAERRAKDSVKQAESEAAKARDSHAKLSQRFAAFETRLAAATQAWEDSRADHVQAAEELAEAREAVAAFPESSDGRDKVNMLRATLAERRSVLVEARSALDGVAREGAERRRRLDALDGDAKSWRARAEAAKAHVEELAERREEIALEIERLASLPDTIARRREELFERLEAAEAARKAAADALVSAEQRLAEADRRMREAEALLANAREERIRREAAVSAADQACRAVAVRIGERLDMTPEQLREVAGLVEEERPDPEELQRKLDRLQRERDNMGPVNLRAEQEVEELEARIAGMVAEKDDLLAAIAKLRHAIGDLNREGRERLLASFQAVDQHFRDLFVKLFGGGRAHLALTESADPLEAGLEIMASPPGKRLQQLSLLSGGEQALTALALLFAVFMTNPAPICVLDEVDAPLDDANVDRFCSLVEGIARATKTRFLIVTHHRMTMARMDRLYGVTMAERGVSQLVSVDLAQAELLRDKVTPA